LLLSWGISSGREGNLYARDRTSIAIAKKWQEGDAPLLHLEKLTDSQWQRRYRGILKLNRPEHDFTKIPIRIRPLVHYMSGGVVINKECETGIDGLYACGEVTGGIDGANRIGGNALTNISYFGLKAGKNAGNYAKGHRELVTTSAKGSKTPVVTPGSGRFQPVDLRRKLNQAMDTLAGPLRSAVGLQEAMNVIADLQLQLADAATDTPDQLKEAIELQSMLTTAKLVTAGAYERKESRGVHFRSDYPTEDPAWQKPILQNKQKGILR
ncbi:MAG TPA: FAD-binding protein, partial [Bacillota bacterium]|nr:FAD-binding protein [Bacillota bacterium]